MILSNKEESVHILHIVWSGYIKVTNILLYAFHYVYDVWYGTTDRGVEGHFLPLLVCFCKYRSICSGPFGNITQSMSDRLLAIP